MNNIKIKLRDYLINNLASKNIPIYFDSELICTFDLFDECDYHNTRDQKC